MVKALTAADLVAEEIDGRIEGQLLDMANGDQAEFESFMDDVDVLQDVISQQLPLDTSDALYTCIHLQRIGRAPVQTAAQEIGVRILRGWAPRC